ncbi:MAG TPA: hypothetical protein PKI32_05410, partial [Opitutales bacterium]|nr:hypothetical protein [Opitutales bacterium]
MKRFPRSAFLAAVLFAALLPPSAAAEDFGSIYKLSFVELGMSPMDAVSWTFSEDGRQCAAIVKSDLSAWVWYKNKNGPKYDDIGEGSLVLSRDGS